jgi:hypothetical protein
LDLQHRNSIGVLQDEVFTYNTSQFAAQLGYTNYSTCPGQSVAAATPSSTQAVFDNVWDQQPEVEEVVSFPIDDFVQGAKTIGSKVWKQGDEGLKKGLLELRASGAPKEAMENFIKQKNRTTQQQVIDEALKPLRERIQTSGTASKEMVDDQLAQLANDINSPKPKNEIDLSFWVKCLGISEVRLIAFVDAVRSRQIHSEPYRQMGSSNYQASAPATKLVVSTPNTAPAQPPTQFKSKDKCPQGVTVHDIEPRNPAMITVSLQTQ